MYRRPANLLIIMQTFMEHCYCVPCRTVGRRDELRQQRETEDVVFPCVGTMPRKPRPQTRRDGTACVVGERQLNFCCLAAFVDNVTHALQMGLCDRPPLVNPKWRLDAYKTLWRSAIGNAYSTTKTANGTCGVRH